MNAEERPDPSVRPRVRASAALVRGAAYFALWLVLQPTANPADLAVGMLAAASATSVSLRLLPAEYGRLHAGRLLLLLPRFVWASMLGGIDVARRALDPRMPLRAGFVAFRSSLPRGFVRNTFATVTSLLPGALAADESDDVLVYHCIDDTAAVVEQLGEQERLIAATSIAGHPS